MSTTNKDDDQENTYRKHEKLITELPKIVGWTGAELFLYQGSWLYKDVLLGAMLIQNHFKPQSTDIISSSFMKSGTTWLRALIFSTLNRYTFDFNDHPLLQKGPHEVFPLLDLQFTNMKDHPPPRLFATHFAHSLLPSSATDPSFGCKFVYIYRDPKDVMVSMFHFLKKFRRKELNTLSLDQAFEQFCDGDTPYGPFWDHVLGFWKASLSYPNKILFLKYEEIKREPEVNVKRLAEFLGVPFSVDEEENGVVEKVVKLCSFEHLTNLEVNRSGTFQLTKGIKLENKRFFRRGEVGDWENHLTPEMRQQMDGIMKEKFKGSGFDY